MKVKDLLKLDIDVDVIDDICDALEIAFVGPKTLTDEGKEEFKDVLEYEVKLNKEYGYCVIPCDNDPDIKWSKKLKRATALFTALAGYCYEKDYNKWFKEE